MTHKWTGSTAFALVERARRSGMMDGAICDALVVSESTIRAWQSNPEATPRKATREKLDALAAKLRGRGR